MVTGIAATVDPTIGEPVLSVRELDVMQRVGDISMAACIDCHQQKQAPARCDTCHDPR